MEITDIIYTVLTKYTKRPKIAFCLNQYDVIYNVAKDAGVPFGELYENLRDRKNARKYDVQRVPGLTATLALQFNKKIYFNMLTMRSVHVSEAIFTVLHEYYHTIDRHVTDKNAEIRADKFALKELKNWCSLVDTYEKQKA